MSAKIFLCYAHEDEALLRELKKHLQSLQQQGNVTLWDDGDISAGTEREAAIVKHLDDSQIILLLISPDFLVSEQRHLSQIQHAMAQHERGKARVIPIILRPAQWHNTPFGKLQALPKNERPIIKWSRRDDAFLAVVDGIRSVLAEVSPKPSFSLPPTLSERSSESASVLNSGQRNRTIIDLGIEAAKRLRADTFPVSLADLRAEYLRANPSIPKDKAANSFDATMNYHCINMRSRFSDPRNKHKSDSWLTRPVFKRIARGQYMLLSSEELALFQRRVAEGDPRIYQDEYDIDDLR